MIHGPAVEAVVNHHQFFKLILGHTHTHSTGSIFTEVHAQLTKSFLTFMSPKTSHLHSNFLLLFNCSCCSSQGVVRM